MKERRWTNWIARRARLLMSLMICGLTVCAGSGCAERVRTVVLTPPTALLADCPPPAVPDELMRTKNLRVYALAASQHIVQLNTALEMCNGQMAAHRAWLHDAARGAK